MELNQEEAEMVSRFIMANWEVFSEVAEELMCACALQRLADKMRLLNINQNYQT